VFIEKRKGSDDKPTDQVNQDPNVPWPPKFGQT
jgi:hypothetical protein